MSKRPFMRTINKGIYEGFCLLEMATHRLGERQELISVATSNAG